MAEIDLTKYKCWTCGDSGDVNTIDGQWRGECTACDAAEIIRMRGQIERMQHQADQADQIDVRSIVDALSWLGVSTPEGGTEAAAARLGRLVNDLSAAVLRHKIDHRSMREKIERLRGALNTIAMHIDSSWPERCQESVFQARVALLEQK